MSPSFFFPLIRSDPDSRVCMFSIDPVETLLLRLKTLIYFPFVKRTYLRVRDMCVESLVRNTIDLVRCSEVYFLFSSCAWLFFRLPAQRILTCWKKKKKSWRQRFFFFISEVSSSAEYSWYFWLGFLRSQFTEFFLSNKKRRKFRVHPVKIPASVIHSLMPSLK